MMLLQVSHLNNDEEWGGGGWGGGGRDVSGIVNHKDFFKHLGVNVKLLGVSYLNNGVGGWGR